MYVTGFASPGMRTESDRRGADTPKGCGQCGAEGYARTRARSGRAACADGIGGLTSSASKTPSATSTKVAANGSASRPVASSGASGSASFVTEAFRRRACPSTSLLADAASARRRTKPASPAPSASPDNTNTAAAAGGSRATTSLAASGSRVGGGSGSPGKACKECRGVHKNEDKNGDIKAHLHTLIRKCYAELVSRQHLAARRGLIPEKSAVRVRMKCRWFASRQHNGTTVRCSITCKYSPAAKRYPQCSRHGGGIRL